MSSGPRRRLSGFEFTRQAEFPIGKRLRSECNKVLSEFPRPLMRGCGVSKMRRREILVTFLHNLELGCAHILC